MSKAAENLCVIVLGGGFLLCPVILVSAIFIPFAVVSFLLSIDALIMFLASFGLQSIHNRNTKS
jgi:hypothetical protein